MGSIGEIFADAGLHVDKASFAEYGSMLKSVEGNISSFSSLANGALITAFTLPAATLAGIAAYGTQIASSYEDAILTLKTLYGSQEAAQEKFQWLSDFAASTPFEFPELLEAATRLKAYGMDVEQYGQTIGDTASAMGKPIMAVVEAIADAQQGEFERMKEFGIKAVEITKKNYEQLGASIQDAGRTALTYMDENGKQQIAVIDRNNKEMITSTIQSIWNDKYAGAMEERSRSFTGMISTIKDNLKNGLAELAGFDMGTATIETGSLLGALKELAGVVLTVSGAFAGMSEPMQTFVLVAATGAAAAGLLAAGFIAYNLILPIATAETFAFGATLTAAIWPVTLVVGALALVAAGLVYLNEKTGIVTYAWNLFKDLFIIVADGIMRAAGIMKDFVVLKLEETKQAIVDMIPPWALEGVTNFVDGVVTQFTDMGNNIHEKAVTIGEDNAKIGTSSVDASIQVTSATGQMQNDYANTGLAGFLMGNQIDTATGLMTTGMNNTGSAATGMSGQVAGAAGGVNTLSTSMQTGSSMAATFVSYLNQVSSSFVSVKSNADAAAKAMQAAGASMEQAQKAYHSYMVSTQPGNQPGIVSKGDSGTGEGNVKIKANPNAYTASEAATRSANNVVYNNNKVNTINNYNSSKSTSSLTY